MTRRVWLWLVAALCALAAVMALGSRTNNPPMDPGSPPEVTTMGDTPEYPHR